MSDLVTIEDMLDEYQAVICVIVDAMHSVQSASHGMSTCDARMCALQLIEDKVSKRLVDPIKTDGAKETLLARYMRGDSITAVKR